MAAFRNAEGSQIKVLLATLKHYKLFKMAFYFPMILKNSLNNIRSVCDTWNCLHGTINEKLQSKSTVTTISGSIRRPSKLWTVSHRWHCMHRSYRNRNEIQEFFYLSYE